MDTGSWREEGFVGQRLTILPLPVIRRAARLPIARDLVVTHTGRFDRATRHHVERPGGRPEHVFIFCLCGEGRVSFDGGSFRLGCGDGVILPPRLAHGYTADLAVPWSIVWFHFVGRRAGDYVRSLGVGDHDPRFGVAQTEPITAAFEECYRYTLGHWSDAELVALTTSFARLLGLCGSLRRTQGERQQPEARVTRALEFMRQNLSRPVGLAELASEASLSIPRFTALFAERMKCSPIDFHIRLKMQRASELLVSTPLPASEIGRLLGYEDPFYFSRLFKQKVGLSPRDYRRHAAGVDPSLISGN